MLGNRCVQVKELAALDNNFFLMRDHLAQDHKFMRAKEGAVQGNHYLQVRVQTAPGIKCIPVRE